jgi:predicted  nucleic acid-binding Zn-ribbon protein
MKLTEIENLTAADLKARKAELIEAAQAAGSAELAARFVQARTDAATRDAKLAEQGETISNLNAALQTATTQLANAEANAQTLTRARAEAEKQLALKQEAVAQLQKAVAETGAKASAALALAKSRRAALADIMQHANQLAGRIAPLLADEG